MVSKEILVQYSDLREEVKYLEKKIDKLKNEKVEKCKSFREDSVKGTSKDYPYIEQHYHIEGLANIEEMCYNAKINKQIKKLQNRYEKLLDLTNEVIDYIDSIKESHIRMIITYRFIENYSWEKVAEAMGGGNTEGSVKMAFQRFWGKN